MPIEEEVIQGSQSEDEEIRGSSDDNTDDVMSMFGIEEEEEEKSVNDNPPAKEEVKETKPEPKVIKVKHNKEEIEVDVSDEKIPEYVQRSLALDKERERKTELEKNLDRAARLAGFKDHNEFVANLDRIEQEQQEKEKNAHNILMQELRQQAEDAGLDPDQVENYLNNHPFVKQAQEAVAEREASRIEQEKQTQERIRFDQWQELYNNPQVLAAFPNIVAESKGFETGELVPFFTDAMQSMYNNGYKPLDAFKLAHMDKLQAQTKTKTEQRLIKEQQLGLRSQVETSSEVDNETQVPSAVADAFKAFGMTETDAKKYMTK